MSKLKIKCGQFWCIACHDTKSTLLKLDQVRICVRCLNQLQGKGFVSVIDGGGRLEMSKEVPGLVLHVVPKAAEPKAIESEEGALADGAENYKVDEIKEDKNGTVDSSTK
jgi:hypothetical protein